MAKLERPPAGARPVIQARPDAFEQRNLNLAENLVSQDDVIDRLNREIFHDALEIGDEPDTRASGPRT